MLVGPLAKQRLVRGLISVQSVETDALMREVNLMHQATCLVATTRAFCEFQAAIARGEKLAVANFTTKPRCRRDATKRR